MSAGTNPATAAFNIDSWVPIPITHKVIPSNRPCPFPKNTNGAKSEEKITANIRAQMSMRSHSPPKSQGPDRVNPHSPSVKYRNLAVKCDRLFSLRAILDRLRGMDGFAVYEILQSDPITRSIRVILLTAKVWPRDVLNLPRWR